MDTLVRFGFSIEEIKNMMDSNMEIENINDKNILKLIKLLEFENCTERIIKNIFITNPFYLSRNPDDIEKLFNELKKLGVKKLNIFFDTNPYLLNLSEDYLKMLIKNKKLKGNELIDFLYKEISHII